MATSALQGYKGLMLTSSSAGGSVTAIAELRDYTLSIEHTPIDATSHDSSGSREKIGGIDSWSGSAELLHVQGNATHQNLQDRITGKEKIEFEFHPTGSSSDGNYQGSGFVTGYDLGSPNEDALNASVTFEGTGTLTRSTS